MTSIAGRVTSTVGRATRPADWVTSSANRVTSSAGRATSTADWVSVSTNRLGRSKKRRLSQAQAAVVGGDLAVGPHGERGRAQERNEPVEEQPVLEDAAGEDDGIQIFARRQIAHCACDPRGQTVVEGAGDLGLGAPGLAVFDQCREQRSKIQLLSVEGHRVAGDVRAGRARPVLQPDRGLPLEADLAREAEEGGRGVEEAPGRGGGENAQVFFDQFPRLQVAARKIERSGG